MVKKTPASRLADMPANLIKLTPRPVTMPEYMVVDANGKELFRENRVWYAIDHAGRRDAKGEKVEVVGWDDTVGRHRPIGEFKTKINDHGDMEGDWRAVWKQRQESAKAKRSGAVKAPTEKAIKRDDKTADLMKNLSMILNAASVSTRKGILSEDELAGIYKEVSDLADHIYGLLPDTPVSEEDLAAVE